MMTKGLDYKLILRQVSENFNRIKQKKKEEEEEDDK